MTDWPVCSSRNEISKIYIPRRNSPLIDKVHCMWLVNNRLQFLLCYISVVDLREISQSGSDMESAAQATRLSKTPSKQEVADENVFFFLLILQSLGTMHLANPFLFQVVQIQCSFQFHLLRGALVQSQSHHTARFYVLDHVRSRSRSSSMTPSVPRVH